MRRGYERGWTWPKKLRNILAADGTNVATEDALGVTGDLENARRPRLSNEQNPVRLDRAWYVDRLTIAATQIHIGRNLRHKPQRARAVLFLAWGLGDIYIVHSLTRPILLQLRH